MRLLIICICVLLSFQLNAQSNKRADSLLKIAKAHFKSTHKMQRDESRELYINAANAGSAYAMYELYHSYRFGMNLAHKVDKDMAKEWLLKGAEAGYPTCRLHLARQYSDKKDNWFPYDISKSLYWSIKAAETGNSYAQVELAEIYMAGEIVKKNYVKARVWLEKASTSKPSGGDKKACNLLGDIYYSGKGVDKDYGKAKEWYEQAGDNRDALSRLAEMYAAGKGVVKDGHKAISYYERAIGTNYDKHKWQNKIGEIYLHGMGIEPNYKKAKEIFEEVYACEGKCPYSADAARNLSRFYNSKVTGYANEDLSLFYFEQSAKRGHPYVLEGLVSYYSEKGNEAKKIEWLELQASYYHEREQYYNTIFKSKKTQEKAIKGDQFRALRHLGLIYYKKTSRTERFKALDCYERIMADYSDVSYHKEHDFYCKRASTLRKEYAGTALLADYKKRHGSRYLKYSRKCNYN